MRASLFLAAVLIFRMTSTLAAQEGGEGKKERKFSSQEFTTLWSRYIPTTTEELRKNLDHGVENLVAIQGKVAWLKAKPQTDGRDAEIKKWTADYDRERAHFLEDLAIAADWIARAKDVDTVAKPDPAVAAEKKPDPVEKR